MSPQLSSHEHWQAEGMPAVWGEGALFAFSGLDGPTCAASQFVATFDREPYDLLIHTPRRVRLRVRLSEVGRVLAATGDVLAVQTTQGELILVYSAWHTLCGKIPAGAHVSLSAVDALPGDEPAPDVVRADSEHGLLALAQSGDRFALAYGHDPQAARERAALGLTADLDRHIADRLAIYSKLFAARTPEEARFLNKCLSVIKVNTLAPEGAFPHTWSTPDRVPHRHMWLWDSVFHSLAMNRIDPRLAWELLLSVLERQRPDGLIPNMLMVDGRTSDITQPPLLAWGVWENYIVSGERDRLADALPHLEAYLEWNLAQRDRNKNGLLEWDIEENENCRSGESGMDNSPRFDRALTLDAVDFSTFQSLDMGYTARIAGELGCDDKARRWRERAAAMSQAVHARLWHPALAFYCDRDMEGELSPVRAESGFLPLLLDDLAPERVEPLVRALNDPRAFAAPCPVPSVSLDDPAWCTDMWRGATWINYNYLIILGLRHQGRQTEADRLREQTLELVRRNYERFGVIFEFFDAKGERTPPECDRKGPRRLPYDLRRKYDSIRDYHWSAALCLCLMS